MKIQNIKKIVLGSVLFFASVAMAVAANPGASQVSAIEQCGNVATVVISSCPETSDAKEIIFSLLKKAIIILSALVGVAAVVIIIAAGMMYMSAADKEAQVQQSKTMIFNVVLGVVLFGLMYAIINFIIPGGIAWTI